jgi:phosphoglycerate dehydrogenase-like enzyme
MRVLIYISWPVKAWCFPERQVGVLRDRFPELDFEYCVTERDALNAVKDADIAFSSRMAASIVEQATRLRWVHSAAAAVQGLLPLADLARRGIAVSNSRGIQAIPIAEQVMAGLLGVARRLDLTITAQKEHQWIQARLCESDWPWVLHGQSMTVVGLGTIGSEVARRAHAFGMRVTGVRRNIQNENPSFVDRVVARDRLTDALTGCDILVVSAPGVAETNRLIGREELAMLNPGATIVNVARGAIVDEQAMIEALRSGRLRAAVLDVFEHEPLDPSSPLWSLPNVIITPHSSGFRANHWDKVIDLFTENLRRFQRSETLLNLVDCAAGY